MQLTFLAGVQAAYRESGLLGTGPVSVLNQSGRNADFVRWYGEAYEAIQNLRDNWNFLWASSADAPYTLTADKNVYDPVTDFGIVGGVAEWDPEGSYVWPVTGSIANRLFMKYLPWVTFRDLVVGNIAHGMPTNFTERPDGKIQYYPNPVTSYYAVHEYWRKPDVLVVDADIPILNQRFHMAIVWKTVMLYCEFAKDWSRFETAQGKYEDVMDALYARAQQKWTMGGPLA